MLLEWQEQLDNKDQLDHQDLGVEEWCTQDGERAPAQVFQELNWSMQTEQEELNNMVIVAEEQTNSACQSIPSTAVITQEYRALATCMELNMKYL